MITTIIIDNTTSSISYLMLNHLSHGHLSFQGWFVPGLQLTLHQDWCDFTEVDDTIAIPVKCVSNLLHLNLAHGQT